MEKYSFIISVYKNDPPAFLRESIESMLAQTAFPDEIVLVKDGALTEGLDSVIAEYDEKYKGVFTIVCNPENLGLGKSLNVAINAARNELLARMDADDICLPGRCEKQLKAFENDKDLDIIGTSTCAFINDPDLPISENHAACTADAIYKRGKRRAAFSHVTVMYKKSTVLKYGGYGDYRRAQDTDLFCRMIYGGCKAANIDEILVKVRKDETMMLRKRSKQSVRCSLEIRKKLWKMGYMSFFDYAYVWLRYHAASLLPQKLYSKVYMKAFKSKSA